MALQYSIQSELMPNHLPGTPADIVTGSGILTGSPSYVFGATGTGGKPLVFARNSKTQFSAFIPSETNPSCWEQVDLSSQLVGGRQLNVTAACVKQKADGSLRMAIAFSALDGVAAPFLFYAESLQPFTDPDAWKNIIGSFIYIGGFYNIGSKPFEPILAIDMGEELMPLQCIYVNRPKDLTNSNDLWTCPIPGQGVDDNPYPVNDSDATFYSFAAGRMMVKLGPDFTAPVSGVYYSFDKSNGKSSVLFEYLSSNGISRVIFPDVDGKVTLASKPFSGSENPFGITSLYTINGSQLQCWTPDMQTNRVAPTQSVTLTGADSFAFSSVASSPNWPTHDLFIKASHGGDKPYSDLLQGVARNDGSIDMPLKIDTNIFANIKPFAWRTPGSSKPQCCLHLITVYAEADTPAIDSLLRIQDCMTGQWQSIDILLDGNTGHSEIPTYTTHIRVTDENNNPQPLKEYILKPDYTCNVYIAGKLIHFDGLHEVRATTDPAGQFSIMMASKSTSVPTWTLQEVGTGTPAQNFNPCDLPQQRLKAVQSVDDIKKAQRSSGGSVFPNGISDQKCNDALAGLQKINDVHDRMMAARKTNWLQTHEWSASAPRNVVRCTRFEFVPGQPLKVTTYEGENVPVENGGIFDAMFGTVMDFLYTTIKSVEETVSWVIKETAEGIVTLAITIGSLVYEALVAVGNALMDVTNWMLQKTLGITLQDIIDWVGFVFNWDDILLNHRAIKAIINCGMVYGENVLKNQGNQLVQNAANFLTEHLNGGIPPVNDDRIKTLLKSNSTNAGKQAPDSPVEKTNSTSQSQWANSKLTNYHSSIGLNVTAPNNFQGITFSDGQQKIMSDLESLFSGFFSEDIQFTSFGDIMNKIYQLLKSMMTDAIDLMSDIALQILDQISELIEVFKKIINTPIQIPILTSLYQAITDGEDFTILNAICLLAAIPFSVITKVAMGRNPFTGPDVVMMEEAAETGDFLKLFAIPSFSLTQDQVSPTPFIMLVLGTTLIGLDVSVILMHAAFHPNIPVVMGKMTLFSFLDKIICLFVFLTSFGYNVYQWRWGEYKATAWAVIYSVLSTIRLAYRIGDLGLIALHCQGGTDEEQILRFRTSNMAFRFGIGFANVLVGGIVAGALIYKQDWGTNGNLKDLRIQASVLVIISAVSQGISDIITGVSHFVKADKTEKLISYWIGLTALPGVACSGGRCWTSFEAQKIGYPDIGAGPLH